MVFTNVKNSQHKIMLTIKTLKKTSLLGMTSSDVQNSVATSPS